MCVVFVTIFATYAIFAIFLYVYAYSYTIILLCFMITLCCVFIFPRVLIM